MKIILTCLTALFLSQPVLAAPKVLADIAPVHSLLSVVMEGVDEPDLLIKRQIDLHDVTLRPSQVRALQKAEIFVTIGHVMFPWVEEIVPSLTPDAQVVELLSLESVLTLDGVDDHADHDHEVDPHLWLDPKNAKSIALSLADILSTADPENEKSYRENALNFGDRMDLLTTKIAEQFSQLQNTRYMLDHNALQYFENRFGISFEAVISDKSRQTVGLRGAKKIEEDLTGASVCLFAETSEISSFASSLEKSGKIRLAVIDIIGANGNHGPELYENLMTSLADNMVACLKGT